MLTCPLHHLRRNVVAYLALVVALGAGGGYAMAASNNKTITVCADKKTGVLHLKTRGRCKRSQTQVTWNQEGPRGPTGPQGATGLQGQPGAQGPAGVIVWANVATDGTVVAGHGLSVQNTSGGHYQVTVTDPTCSREINAPVVSVSDADPNGLGGQSAAIWFEGTATNEQFRVFTGRIAAGGGFSASNDTFDVLDACP